MRRVSSRGSPRLTFMSSRGRCVEASPSKRPTYRKVDSCHIEHLRYLNLYEPESSKKTLHYCLTSEAITRDKCREVINLRDLWMSRTKDSHCKHKKYR